MTALPDNRWPAADSSREPSRSSPSRTGIRPGTHEAGTASAANPAIVGSTGRGWLRVAMAALAVLASAAAVVSWDAQFVMVQTARRMPVVAALEAGIPDA